MEDQPSYSGGRNIAMKVPPHQWEETVAFYRDTLGLEKIRVDETGPSSASFKFGANHLWIDLVEAISQAELWLELTTTDTKEAADHLRAANITRRDEIEPLPDDLNRFWISNPASIIHLVHQAESDET